MREWGVHMTETEEDIIRTGMEEIKRTSEVFGDDAGAFRLDGRWVVITNDMFVQSTDMIPEMNFQDAGFKAVTANVSDLVAMGSKPAYFGFSIGLPESDADRARLCFRGISEAMDFYGMKLISADTNSANELIIDGIAVGMAEKLLLRKNAKVGEVVCVTGDLGRSLSALLISLKGLEADEKMKKKLFEKILKPRARIEVVDGLSKISNCAIDVSDGLAKELRAISKASGCRIVVDVENIPVSEEVREFCELNSLDPAEIAMNSGEEYEIVFTTSKDALDGVEFDFTVIGEVTKGEGVWMRTDSELKRIRDLSWRHFSDKWVI